MPPIRVEIEGHPPLEFPEGTDPGVIDMVVKRDVLKAASPPTKTEPGFLQKAAPYVRTALELGGLTGGAIVAAPGNLVAPGVAEVAGAGLGYGMGRQAANLYDQAVGIKKPEGFLTEAAQTGKDVVTGAGMEAGGRLIPPILSKGAEYAGKVIKPVLGRLSGTGTGAVDEAIASGTSTGLSVNPLASKTNFDKALRGKITGDEVVANVKDALQTVVNKRGAIYRDQLKNLKGNAQIVDTAPIDKTVNDIMADHNITIATNAKGQQAIDTSKAGMGKAGREDIKGIIEEVKSWTDKTPEGLDRLRKRLDDFYSDSSQARSAVTRLRNSVNDTIKAAVPEYADMTKGYAEATALIKDIESGLMLRKQGMTGKVVADQTLRRITSAMRDNFALRKDLLEALGAKSGEDLSGQVAGYSMRSVIPLGLAGTGPALIGEAAMAKFISPGFWPVLAASSPRVQGEFLRMFGKAMVEAKKVAPVAGKLGAYYGGSQLTQ